MSINAAKMEKFYSQCQKAYDKRRNGTGSTYNGMPSPGVFYDEYNVPAESLYVELCNNNKKWVNERDGFSDRLLEWVYGCRKWDLVSFSEMRKTPLSMDKYSVYLEFFFQCNNYKKKPFSNKIIIDDVQIEWCSKREYSERYNGYIDAERTKENSNFESQSLPIAQGYKENRRFPKIQESAERYIHPIKITLCSSSAYRATIVALEKIDILLNCLNVSQGIQKYSARYFGGSENMLGSKTVFVTTGYYMATNNNGTEAFNSDDAIVSLPKNMYDDSKHEKSLFRKILKAAADESAVQNRVRCVLRDLALAYDSTNAGVKTLGYWRCLEHATRSSQKNRTEKEIIGIFKYQYSNEYWKQMGDLVLCARNKYVHSGLYSGKDEFVDQYVNWAQKYAEQSLYFLLRLHKNKKYWVSEEKIDIFFDNYAKDNDYLEAVQRLYIFRRNRK